MLLASRFHGLDLKVLEPGSDIEFEPRLIRTDQDRENIVRAVQVQAPWFMMGNLMRVLKKTDEELERIVDICGGVVARHEWCLYPAEQIPPGFSYMFPAKDLKRLGVPKDHIVAADVEWVKNGSRRPFIGDEPYDRIENGLESYFSSWGLKQGDTDIRQFVFTPDTAPVYVDVEPCLYVHQAGWGNIWR
jgi:hypothetical protein